MLETKQISIYPKIAKAKITVRKITKRQTVKMEFQLFDRNCLTALNVRRTLENETIKPRYQITDKLSVRKEKEWGEGGAWIRRRSFNQQYK